MRKFKLWSPSPEGKLACHLCRLSSHSHHPWKRERRRQQGRGSQGRREGAKDGGKEGKQTGNMSEEGLGEKLRMQ